jgi:endonuclease/exonuclease/phosphatase family metal-dependent hydrolase
MKPLRIATLNCLNLALPGRRCYAGVEPYTADEYIAKTQWLAAMLDRLAADVVLLQEVFHEQALSDVVRQTAGGAHQWSLAAPLAAQDNDKPRVGVVWRRPARLSWQSIAGFPPGCAVEVPEKGPYTAFSRPLLQAELVLPGDDAPLSIVGVHLKSRRPDFLPGENEADPTAAARAQLRSLIRRGAEAAALRGLVVALQAKRRAALVVAGDFNDTVDAVTTQIVAGPLAGDEAAREVSPRLFDAFELAAPVASVAGGMPAPLTQLGDEGAARIDHVLLSEEFVPGAALPAGRVAAVEVLADHLVERRRGGGLERIYSDHAAVCVELQPLG